MVARNEVKAALTLALTPDKIFIWYHFRVRTRYHSRQGAHVGRGSAVMHARFVTAWPTAVSGEPMSSIEGQLVSFLLGQESSCFGSRSSMKFHATSR